jgi:hypothetical protein
MEGLSRRGGSGGGAKPKLPGGEEGNDWRNGKGTGVLGGSLRKGSVVNSSTAIDICGLSHRRLSGALGRFVGAGFVGVDGFVDGGAVGVIAAFWKGITTFVLAGAVAITPRVGST